MDQRTYVLFAHSGWRANLRQVLGQLRCHQHTRSGLVLEYLRKVLHIRTDGARRVKNALDIWIGSISPL